MDIFGILDPDPDPHKNLGGSGTLLLRHLWKFSKRHDSIHTERQEFDKHCTVYVLYDLPGCDGVEAACGDHQHHHPDLKGGPRHTAEEL